MITCPNCGKENEEGSKFCISCGADLSAKEISKTEKKQIEFVRSAKKLIPVEAFLTIIGVYTFLDAISYTFLSVGLTFGSGIISGLGEMMQGFGGMGYGYGETERTMVLLALAGILYLILGIWAGSAGIGLFRNKMWGNLLTRWFQIPNAIIAIYFAVDNFSPFTVIFGLFTVLVAIGIWKYLEKVEVRSYFK